MGMLNKLWTKTKSFVPGEIGARASGEYDVGRVANAWKKDYVKLLGKMGQKGYGDTKTFIAFLKSLGFTHQQITNVLSVEYSESAQIYEAMLTSKSADTLIMRAAKVAAMAAAGVKNRPLDKEPNPTAPREPGAIDAAVGVGKQVAPAVGKAASAIGKKYADYRQSRDARRSGTTVPQRVEPTLNTPEPAPEQPPRPKYVPTHRPARKQRPVTRYK